MLHKIIKLHFVLLDTISWRTFPFLPCSLKWRKYLSLDSSFLKGIISDECQNKWSLYIVFQNRWKSCVNYVIFITLKSECTYLNSNTLSITYKYFSNLKIIPRACKNETFIETDTHNMWEVMLYSKTCRINIEAGDLKENV